MSPRLLAAPLAIAFALSAPTLHADCELLYAPKALRARLRAFHHASETPRPHARPLAAVPRSCQPVRASQRPRAIRGCAESAVNKPSRIDSRFAQ